MSTSSYVAGNWCRGKRPVLSLNICGPSLNLKFVFKCELSLLLVLVFDSTRSKIPVVRLVKRTLSDFSHADRTILLITTNILFSVVLSLPFSLEVSQLCVTGLEEAR